MNSKKVIRCLFGGMCLLLFGFFGVGVYFCLTQALGAGFLGIGIALICTAVTLWMADGVLFGVVPSDSHTTQHVLAVFDIQACLENGCMQDGSVTLQQKFISIVGFHEDKEEMVMYRNIRKLSREKDCVRMVCKSLSDSMIHDGVLEMKFGSPIKAKAFEDTVTQCQIVSEGESH